VEIEQFSNVTQVIYEPLKFKAKLAIGENAYTTLKLKNRLADFWELAGGVGTGVAIAKTTVVASTFFAPSGLAGLLGLGVAATPVGWVMAAAVLSGGAALGVRRLLSGATESRVTVIPKFINTPIDVLALDLFDLIAPLVCKIAIVDGQITDDERLCICNYFIEEWGYDSIFIEAGSALIESSLNDFSIKDLAEKFAEFSKANPDCNYTEMTRDLIAFLRTVIEADGIIDEREELAIEKIESIFAETGRTFTQANFEKFGNSVAESLKKGKESLLNSETLDRTKDGLDAAKEITKKGAIETVKAGKTILGKFFNKPV
jgi:tellurite resistance protein